MPNAGEHNPQGGQNPLPPEESNIRWFARVERVLLSGALWEYDEKIKKIKKYDGKIEEISSRGYDAPPDEIYVAIEAGKPHTLVCDLAKQIYDDGLEVYGSVIEKTRTLLGLCPLLITLFGLLLPRLPYPWVGILPMICFLAALLLLLTNIGVSKRSTAKIDNDLISETDAGVVERVIASSYYHAAYLNACRTEYAVDVYKASGRYLAVGSVLLSILLMTSLFAKQQPTVVVQPATMPAPVFNVPPVTMPSPVFNVPPATAPAPVINVLPATMPAPVVNIVIPPATQAPLPSTRPASTQSVP